MKLTLGHISVVWALWYTIAFGYAQIPGTPYSRALLWGGLLIGVALSAPMLARAPRRRDWSVEPFLFLFFFIWVAIGGIFLGSVGDMQSHFDRYIRLTLQNTVIMFLIPVIVLRSGRPEIFLLGVIGAAFLLILGQFGNPLEFLRGDQMMEHERAEFPNRLGGLAVLGIISILALFPMWNQSAVRIALAISMIGVLTLGIILSASRGAIVMLMMLFAFWPIFCLRSYFRRGWVPWVIVFSVGLGGLLLAPWFLEMTNAGRRFLLMLEMGDGSTQTRLALALTGIRLWWENPIMGVGLGNYPLMSGTGRSSHSELIELLSTTGLIGAMLMYSVYAAVVFRALSLKRKTGDPLIRYYASVIALAVIVAASSGVFFELPFLRPHIMVFLAIMIGWSLALKRAHSNAGLEWRAPSRQGHKVATVAGA